MSNLLRIIFSCIFPPDFFTIAVYNVCEMNAHVVFLLLLFFDAINVAFRGAFVNNAVSPSNAPLPTATISLCPAN